MIAWLIGAVAGLLFGDGWPHLRLADSLVAASSLPRHLGDPRSGWSASVRSALPGAAGMYVAAVLVMAPLGLVSGLLGRRWLGREHAPAIARWATNKQLHSLLFRTPQPSRVTHGRRGRQLVCCEPLHSTLVIA